MNGWLARWRQKTFPAELRIDFAALEIWTECLATALAAATPELTPSPSPPTTAITEEFAVDLCNLLFRLQRNAEQLATEGADSKELRSIRRALESLNELLSSRGIEYRDPTGQAYDFLRLDFEQIGEPELVPGLDGLKVWRCERPAVLMNGALIRKARGVVAKPA